MEVIAPDKGMSQDLREEVDSEIEEAEVDLEEVEEVAITVMEEAVVALQEKLTLSATTARTSGTLQETAQNLEKKDHQEMMTTHKIVEATSVEKTMMEETSTIMVAEKREVDPVGIMSKMKVREAPGTKETSSGEATITTPIDQVKTLPKEQVVAGADLALKEEASVIHKIILQEVVGTECLQITNSYVSNA